MIVYAYTTDEYCKQDEDILFLKKGDVIYSLSSSSNINDFTIIDKANDIVIYFGGHSVLYHLFEFGFDSSLNYIDLKYLFWNKDTSLTNLNLFNCYSTYCLNDIEACDSNCLENTEVTNENFKLKLYLLLEQFVRLEKQMIVIEKDNICFNDINYIFLVLEKLYSKVRLDDRVYANDIDLELSKSLVKLEKTSTKLDLGYLAKLKNDINKRLDDILENIYFLTKRRFNINSQRELNYVLKDIGILNNKVSKLELNNSFEQTGLLLFKYIEQFRRLTMCYEQYLKPLYKSSVINGYGRFRYNECRVPCLTKGHFCIERTKGIVDVSEIEYNDYIWTEYGFKRVIRAERHLTSDLTRVELSNGLSITGTNHHPILVNSFYDCSKRGVVHTITKEWCSLENVCIGERVITPLNYSCVRNLNSNVTKNIAIIVCSILNSYINSNNEDLNYLELKNIRFSKKLSFEKFKSFCELLGLKNICFCINSDFSVYDVLIYNFDGLKFLLNNYYDLMSDCVRKQIELVLKNITYTSCYEENSCFFMNDYEEVIVTKVIKLNEEDYVYDIEVEDVHQYNSNCVINHNTGRLSSFKSSRTKDFNEFTNVNIQSIPKQIIESVNIRKAFIVDDDCYWCCIDYKSQELRLVSNLYNIKYINDIPLNDDVYSLIGHKFNVFDKLDLKKKRDAIKVICLGIVYGLTNFGIRSQLKYLGIEDDIDFREEFFNLFPELKLGQKKTLEYAHAANGVYTLSGRFRRINFTQYDRENFFSRNNRIALNTVVQGSCGDIIRNVINNIEKTIEPVYNKYGFKLLNTIHDEINFSIPKDNVLFDEVINKIIYFIKRPFEAKKDLEFGYSISIGNNWGELKELKSF